MDIDNDGDFDLFSGEFLGTINFYRNNGTANSPSFELVTNQYLDIGHENDRVYSDPTFTDIDSDGDQDLMIGFDNREILLYRNMGSPETATFELDTSLAIDVRRRFSLTLTTMATWIFFQAETGADYSFMKIKNSSPPWRPTEAIRSFPMESCCSKTTRIPSIRRQKLPTA